MEFFLKKNIRIRIIRISWVVCTEIQCIRKRWQHWFQFFIKIEKNLILVHRSFFLAIFLIDFFLKKSTCIIYVISQNGETAAKQGQINWCPVLEKQVKQKNYLQRISVSFEKFDDNLMMNSINNFNRNTTINQSTNSRYEIIILFFFLIQEFDSTLPL